MSESFYLSIIGLGVGCITGICLQGFKTMYKIKCSDINCFGIMCTRDVEAKNEADYNSNTTDVIPPINQRRNSSIN